MGTSTKTPKGAPVSTPRKAVLPRTPRSSAVTLILSEEAKIYAEELTTATRKIPLAEVGIEKMKMRKVMTSAIVLEVPGDKDREKASVLATCLAQILDPATVKVAAPARMAELRVVGIDISIAKEELRNALALAAGCSGAEVQVGEIGTSRGGLGSAWVRCPLVEARSAPFRELLGAPGAHRMGREACCPPRRNKKRILPTTVEKSTADTPCAKGRTTKAVDGREEAIDLVQ
jgi:hypothetical protein